MPVVEVTLSVKMTLYFTIIQFVRLLRLPLAFFTDRPRRREKKRKRVITYYTYEVRFSLRKVAKISSHSLRLLLDSLTSRNAAILHDVGSEGIVYAVALYPYLS